MTESIAACVLIVEALAEYGDSAISDLFGNDEKFMRGFRAAKQVAARQERRALRGRGPRPCPTPNPENPT